MQEKEIINKIFKSTSCGDFKVIRFVEKRNDCKRYEIEFIETGFRNIVYSTNIVKGRVTDKSIKNNLGRYRIGQIIDAPNDKVEILDVEKQPRKSNPSETRTILTIKFLSTGYITKCHPEHIAKDKIKDYLKPTVVGVGILGYVQDIEGNLRDMKEYRIWEGMMHRCYQDSYEFKNRSYETAEVCERWIRFDYFLEDIVRVPGYDLWKQYYLDHKNSKNIYEFDKDTIVKNNKLYSLETCRFIPKYINAGFTTWASQETKIELLKELEDINNETTRG